MNNGTRSRRPSRAALLSLIQGDTSYVYALLTRHGAVKIGVTGRLATRYHHIEFGGAEKYLGFMPGEYVDEQAIHAAMPDDARIGKHREYYYPLHECVLAPINAMRSDMGIAPLTRRDLPRPGRWTQHLPQPDRPVSWQLPYPWGPGDLRKTG